MAIKSWTLIDLDRDPGRDTFADHWSVELPPHEFPGCRLERRSLHGGLRDGLDLLTIDNGRFRTALLPQRGMGIWKAWLDDWEIGWNSPVRGPVHPRFVPLAEPSGLGWLDGFDELLCRCGLVSNGAPDFDSRGQLVHSLHGRIASLPAHRLVVQADSDSGEISVTGVVDECRFHFHKLRLTSTLRTRPGEAGFRLIDEVTNLSGNPGEMQLLYHINFGPPLLEPGARIVAPVKRVMPRDSHAALRAKTWDHYEQPRMGAEEEVYFFELLAGDDGRTQALLKNPAGDRGISLRFHKHELPCFTLWKNGPPAADSYVTGLEPGTNFPNPRSFEKSQGRVRQLAPGETVRFELALEAHADADAVRQAGEAVAHLQASAVPNVIDKPQPGWTTG